MIWTSIYPIYEPIKTKVVYVTLISFWDKQTFSTYTSYKNAYTFATICEIINGVKTETTFSLNSVPYI